MFISRKDYRKLLNSSANKKEQERLERESLRRTFNNVFSEIDLVAKEIDRINERLCRIEEDLGIDSIKINVEVVDE